MNNFLKKYNRISGVMVSVLALSKYNRIGGVMVSVLALGKYNRIGGVMVSVLALSAVDRGFDARSGQTKDYKIGICCFSAKHAALRRKSKDWFFFRYTAIHPLDDH